MPADSARPEDDDTTRQQLTQAGSISFELRFDMQHAECNNCNSLAALHAESKPSNDMPAMMGARLRPSASQGGCALCPARYSPRRKLASAASSLGARAPGPAPALCRLAAGAWPAHVATQPLGPYRGAVCSCCNLAAVAVALLCFYLSRRANYHCLCGSREATLLLCLSSACGAVPGALWSACLPLNWPLQVS